MMCYCFCIQGVAIISVTQTGFVFSGSDGDGVVVKHNDDGSWGVPSALEFGGASAGAIFGRSNKQIFLFPMSEYSLKMLTSKTRYQLGIEIGLAIGKHGGEAEAGVTAGGKGAGGTLTYTFENGVLMDIGFNNYFVGNVEKINNAFYGKEIDPTDLVMSDGIVDIPEGKGIEDLQKKLGILSAKKDDEQESEKKSKTKDEKKSKSKDEKKSKGKDKNMETIIERANTALDVAAKNKKMIPGFVWRECKVRRISLF